MMLASLLLAFATTALAYNSTGPFAIHITGKTNSSIDGYVGACHAGAAIEGLCYADATANLSSTYYQYYYNYSSYNTETGEVYQPGWITWLLPYTGPDGPTTEPEPLSFQMSYSSNVHVGLFEPSETYSYLNFYPDNGTFYINGGYDDSSFNETYPNPAPTYGDLTNFHLCYQFTGGYYYESIAWVSTLPPHNPSCQPVDLTMVPLP